MSSQRRRREAGCIAPSPSSSSTRRAACSSRSAPSRRSPSLACGPTPAARTRCTAACLRRSTTQRRRAAAPTCRCLAPSTRHGASCCTSWASSRRSCRTTTSDSSRASITGPRTPSPTARRHPGASTRSTTSSSCAVRWTSRPTWTRWTSAGTSRPTSCARCCMRTGCGGARGSWVSWSEEASSGGLTSTRPWRVTAATSTRRSPTSTRLRSTWPCTTCPRTGRSPGYDR
mmetsp:Transcript_45100/g.108225  ORF Transcript_45100/g.108225 Transcript_45100/m.108225 type:complete len:230 (+) Transcript_45100:328-1017(+)